MNPTKSKPRKPATKAWAPNPYYEDDRFPIETRYDKKFTSDDIPKLIARWRFLEADRQYHAAVMHPELANCAFRRHTEESAKIMEKLLCMVPDNYKDVTALLKFSIERLAAMLNALGDSDKSIVRMLKNVSAGVFKSETKAIVDAAERMLLRCEETISEN